MKRSHTVAAGLFLSLGLGLAAGAHAHPGMMGGGMGPGMHGGMQHSMKAGMGPGAMKGGPAGPAAAQQLMTPEERTALMEKIRNAKTPEERQRIVQATRTEMQKRAQEKGITLPEHRGPHGRMGFGPNAAPAQLAPTTTEHAH